MPPTRDLHFLFPCAYCKGMLVWKIIASVQHPACLGPTAPPPPKDGVASDPTQACSKRKTMRDYSRTDSKPGPGLTSKWPSLCNLNNSGRSFGLFIWLLFSHKHEIESNHKFKWELPKLFFTSSTPSNFAPLCLKPKNLPCCLKPPKSSHRWPQVQNALSNL